MIFYIFTLNRRFLNMKEVEKTLVKKYLTKWLVGVALLSTIWSSFTINDSGNSMRIQNNLTGEHTWATTEGIQIKVPFFSKVVTYPQKITVAITSDENICEAASICSSPVSVSFADTYTITPEVSFRYSLSTIPDSLEEMHDAVKTPTNLLGNTLVPFSKELVGYTAAQFRAEDFSQGGQNEYKQRMLDQATNGLLVTERRKVIIERETADSGHDRSESTKLAKQYRFEIEIKYDESGRPKRIPVSISDYNISVVKSGVSLISYTPESDLQNFMSSKKARIMARAEIQEEQENKRQEAITEQLKGERDIITQTNKQRKEKESARIQAEKQVMQAKLQAERETVERQKVADLAIIDKQRELQIAEAELAIQEANAQAAVFEAKAIKETGFAQVAVEKARLAAKQSNKDIYLAELELQQTKAMAEVLPNVNIQSPQIVMGSSGTGGNQVSDLLSTKLVKDLIIPSSK